MLSYGHKTDVGLTRKTNQDSLAVLNAAMLDGLADGLFVVADGMGGHRGGETASRLTVETLPESVRAILAEEGLEPDVDALEHALREGLRAANTAVRRAARANPGLHGMGTTCVAVLVRDSTAVIGNVGDSRIYMLRDGELVRLTRDHSLVEDYVRNGDLTPEEARASRFRNVITRAIGIADTVQPDVEAMHLQEGDTLLLCSDGLTTMVTDEEIEQVLTACPDARQACDRLVQAANQGGGADNITAVVVRYGVFEPASTRPEAIPQDDTDEDAFFKPTPVPRAASSRRRSRLPGLLTALLFLFLGMALGYLGHARYTLTTHWPYLQPRKPAVPSPVRPVLPALDMSRLLYAPPEVLTRKPMRGAPLACDAQGNLYGVSEGGRVLRISSDGRVVTPMPRGIPAPESRGGVYWAADTQGNLYLSVRADRAVYKFDRNGTRVAVLGDRRLDSPEAIAVDGAGSVYVVDLGRLKVFRARSSREPAEEPRTTPGGLPLAVEDGDGTR